MSRHRSEPRNMLVTSSMNMINYTVKLTIFSLRRASSDILHQYFILYTRNYSPRFTYAPFALVVSGRIPMYVIYIPLNSTESKSIQDEAKPFASPIGRKLHWSKITCIQWFGLGIELKRAGFKVQYAIIVLIVTSYWSEECVLYRSLRIV